MFLSSSHILRNSLLILIWSFIFFFILFSYERVIANTGTQNDITSPGFELRLDSLNPVKPTQSASTPQDISGVKSLEFLLSQLARFLMIILPIIAGISFIIAGYYYVLSGGDTEKATQAKTIIKWNLIAIVIALFSYALVRITASILSGSVT